MKFYTYQLFREGIMVSLSYKEIADIYRISIAKARRYIEKDYRAGLFFKKRIPFQKNAYCLSLLGYMRISYDDDMTKVGGEGCQTARHSNHLSFNSG